MPRNTLSSRGRGRNQSARKKREDTEEEIPEVYRELLAEADARAADEPLHDRPVKRRKVGERGVELHNIDSDTNEQDASNPPNLIDLTQSQTIYDVDAEDASEDDSDMEWEEVLVQQPEKNELNTVGVVGDQTLDITLERPSDQRRTIIRRRKPVSGAEKKLRLEIHKAHVLCLLGHVYIRNLWCNDDEVQRFLKQMLTKQMIALLNPKESAPQFTRSTTFIDGLKQASETFARRFRVTAPGLRKPYWAENAEECKDRAESIMRDGEIITSRQDFREQAKLLQGSRDFGAQLFCALLRSAAVEARLVCSLQVLPFSGVAKGTSPEKPKREYIVISSDDNMSSSDDKSVTHLSNTPAQGRRLGQPGFKTPLRSSTSAYFERPRNFSLTPYPVYWVEAYNEAVQKWIPLDPLVTRSVAKPSKFEPPASDRYNSMSYVVAFEEDASARDVTKRYAKAYNAKMRKTRVESTKDGEKWWADIMAHLEKPFLEDRDQLEFSEFTAKSAAEPMPRNIQDFKDHPVYALERHLRRNEVIHPKRKIGQVEASKSGFKKGILEPVYRRADVHLVRSADGWYRLGRDLKIGEQPLKRVAAAHQRDESEDEAEGPSGPETPMYAFFQTEPYKPPPVVNGKVPRNVYGNLDVYVPTMVPPGGFHLRHREASRAARILGIDYADAVTGFEFKGRHGTAVVNGIIAASEYREALSEVIRSIEDEKMQEELDRRTEEALRLWKHFLLKLRIAEKVKSYTIEGEYSDGSDVEEHASEDAAYESDYAEAGGFLLENEGNDMHSITNDDDGEEDLGGGFVPDTDLPDDQKLSTEPKSPATGEYSLHAQQLEVIKQEIPTFAKRKEKVPRYKLIVVPSRVTLEMKDAATNDTIATQSRPTNSAQSDHTVEVSDGGIGDEGSSEAVPIQVDSSSGCVSASASVEVISTGPGDTDSLENSIESAQSESDPDLEKQSLLSHDPEDEDAEPDWLMSE